MSNAIVGRQIIILGNDFVTQDLNASVVTIDEDKQTILLELEQPLSYSSTMYRYAIAAPRFSKDDLGLLVTAGSLGCSVTWVPEDKYSLDEPMDLSWWRGGAAAITDLRIN